MQGLVGSCPIFFRLHLTFASNVEPNRLHRIRRRAHRNSSRDRQFRKSSRVAFFFEQRLQQMTHMPGLDTILKLAAASEASPSSSASPPTSIIIYSLAPRHSPLYGLADSVHRAFQRVPPAAWALSWVTGRCSPPRVMPNFPRPRESSRFHASGGIEDQVESEGLNGIRLGRLRRRLSKPAAYGRGCPAWNRAPSELDWKRL